MTSFSIKINRNANWLKPITSKLIYMMLPFINFFQNCFVFFPCGPDWDGTSRFCSRLSYVLISATEDRMKVTVPNGKNTYRTHKIIFPLLWNKTVQRKVYLTEKVCNTIKQARDGKTERERYPKATKQGKWRKVLWKSFEWTLSLLPPLPANTYTSNWHPKY